MSQLLKNYGNFLAQGTESLGRGISEEETTLGTTTLANGISGTPAQLAAVNAKVGGGLVLATH